MSDFLVKRDDLRECRIAESEPPALAPGQALLRVDRFGLTANNITYAVMGEAMSYWDFFPAEEGWGRVPMWGFAEVERSEAEGVEVGHPRLRLPAAVLAPAGDAGQRRPGRVRRRLAAPRGPALRLPPLPGDRGRPLLPGRHRGDPDAAAAALLHLLPDRRPARRRGPHRRGPIVISSASSKTAIAAAFLLAQRDGVELIGLTSPRSAEFVSGLGIYGRTVTYDAIDALERGPATYVDVAGDAEVRRAVHSHYGKDLVHSMAVGVTHWEEFGGGDSELPGPTPTFFFAPDRVVKRSQDWGRSRPRAARRRRLAPVLRVDRGLAADDPRRGLRRRPRRLPRGARGPRRAEQRPRDLALSRLNVQYLALQAA